MEISRIERATAVALALVIVAAFAAVIGLRLGLIWMLTVSQWTAGGAALLKAKAALDEMGLVGRARRDVQSRLLAMGMEAAQPLQQTIRHARQMVWWSWWFAVLVTGLPLIAGIAKRVPGLEPELLFAMYFFVLGTEMYCKSQAYARLVAAMAESERVLLRRM